MGCVAQQCRCNRWQRFITIRVGLVSYYTTMHWCYVALVQPGKLAGVGLVRQPKSATCLRDTVTEMVPYATLVVVAMKNMASSCIVVMVMHGGSGHHVYLQPIEELAPSSRRTAAINISRAIEAVYPHMEAKTTAPCIPRRSFAW